MKDPLIIEEIDKSFVASQTSRGKYLVRLKILDRYIEDFESETERLMGPHAERWEGLIESCKLYKKQYEAFDKFYNDPDSPVTKLVKDVKTNKDIAREDLKEIHQAMSNINSAYTQVEQELDERIGLVKEMKRLLLLLEEEDNS